MTRISHEETNMARAATLLGILTAALITLLPAWGRAVEVTEAKQDWDYVTVRKDANMFWWLYYTDHPTKNYTEVPLVMWLQGGPGGSSCGFGNFEEIGPRDTKLNPRNSSWTQVANLLFVDNPVGTGYSYVTGSEEFAKDIDTVSSDMLVLLTVFFKSNPEFQKTPFYIFSESYGGKMAAAIALALQKAITAGRIQCTLGGVALGDSWISPIDSVLSWGPYLYSISLLDDRGLKEVQEAASAVQDALTKGHFAKATELWSKTEQVIEENTDDVNFYNIMSKKSSFLSRRTAIHAEQFTSPYVGQLFQHHVQALHSDILDELMNGPIRAKLKIIPDSVQWGGQAPYVFQSMVGDFMKPVVDVVDELLSAGINVTVYNGQLDLIVDTVGQEAWVKNLKWKKLEQFRMLQWSTLHLDTDETAAFYKIYENFSFYWIQKAGHMVPADQPFASLRMLQMILNQL